MLIEVLPPSLAVDPPQHLLVELRLHVRIGLTLEGLWPEEVLDYRHQFRRSLPLAVSQAVAPETAAVGFVKMLGIVVLALE